MQELLKYLADNKEWIFSGVGIIALTSLFTILKKIFMKSRKNNTSTMKQINKGHSSGIQIGIQNNYKSEENDNER